MPIKLPKEPAPAAAPAPAIVAPVTPKAVVATVQPDVIPTKIEAVPPEPAAVPPPAAFTNIEAPAAFEDDIIPPQEIYANVQQVIQKPIETTNETRASVPPSEPAPQSPVPVQSTAAAATVLATESTEHIDPIYQNQEDIAEYIDDTGIRAVALYDYQAAAEDEISFDPDDLITHIEQVSRIVVLYELELFLIEFFLHAYRSMKAGGEVCAKIGLAYSRPTTCNCNSK